MLAKCFLEEVDTEMREGKLLWQGAGDRHGVTLAATNIVLAAIGIGREGCDPAPVGATNALINDAAPDSLVNPDAPLKARTRREGTRQAKLIAMLREPDGTTVEAMKAATGWQAQTVRGAMAGTLRKKLRL